MNSGCIGTYDAAGNMTEGPDGNDPTVKRKYIYDAWNRLAKVTDGETVIAKFEYDAVGRRILKIYDSQSLGTPDGVDACEHYLHAGDQVIETRQADLVAGVAPDADAVNPKYQNVWSQRYIDALILRDENTDPATDDQCDNGRIFYLADANFNVTAIVAESSRGEEDWAVRERYVYTPYGAATILDADFAPVTGNTSAHATTTLYTGRRLDAETGLYYYRARYYHAQLGRFINRDPIGYGAGDANLYRYVGNWPTFFVDPFGSCNIEVFLGHRSFVTKGIEGATDAEAVAGIGCSPENMEDINEYFRRKGYPVVPNLPVIPEAFPPLTEEQVKKEGTAGTLRDQQLADLGGGADRGGFVRPKDVDKKEWPETTPDMQTARRKYQIVMKAFVREVFQHGVDLMAGGDCACEFVTVCFHFDKRGMTMWDFVYDVWGEDFSTALKRARKEFAYDLVGPRSVLSFEEKQKPYWTRGRTWISDKWFIQWVPDIDSVIETGLCFRLHHVLNSPAVKEEVELPGLYNNLPPIQK